MINKNFCLSSYMAYRYIYKNDVDFYEGMKHKNIEPVEKEQRIAVSNYKEIDKFIQSEFDELYKKYNKIGILLSGGMDSAILATYLRKGSNAYTFSTELSDVYAMDNQRSEKYCELLNLNHHYIDISFDDYKKYTPIVMQTKGVPVHSIEPQIYKAAITAKKNGDELIIVGESADLIFGGMNQLLAEEWSFDAFKKRYTFLDPNLVLKNPDNSVFELFEKYRLDNNKIDYLSFMDDVFSIESSSSYLNAFNTAEMPYFDPYARMIMKNKLDLNRVRNGEPKYDIRELFAYKYPSLEVPFKIPMPRPVDTIFKNWEGPTRKEFKEDIPMEQLTGNQKWQLWCAERFLNINEPETLKKNTMKNEIIGYTTGVFDLFHIGHLNLLKNAKGMCDKLVVGVTVDELVAYKGKKALIPFEDRIEIVRACKYVDAAVPQYNMDKLTACKKLGASILFVGDDWYGTEKWNKYEEELKKEGIDVVYFPYTKSISSTKIKETLDNVRKGAWDKDLMDLK